MMKQICKSNTNRKIAGVCGGIGEYFGIDPTLVRLGFVALSLLAGGGLAVYIIAAIIMPEKAVCSRTADNTVNT
ncbi:MAG: PspC domain-containing protein [Oscillospiraceae bacterium]|nr:PspC domain-containing protein [Oscillospiraceae bacterium]